LERQVGGPLYNIAPLVVISLLKLPLSFECEEGKSFETRISVIVWCVDEIQESIRCVGEFVERHFQ
jgi:hypothetical protein